MSMNDYVKFITQTVVQHYEQPKDQRKHKKQQKKENKQPFLMRWFGLLPFAFYSIFKKKG